MKTTWWIDVLRNIKKTWLLFVSIVIIIVIGVTEYTAMNYTSVAMLKSANDFFSGSKMYDLSMSTASGFTQADIDIIKAISGVVAVDTQYSADVYLKNGDVNNLVIKCRSSSDAMNLPTVKEGHLPETTSECMIDSLLADAQSYHVGDKVTFDVPDSYPVSPIISKTFTVCGIGDLADDFTTFDSLGVSSKLGAGNINATVLLYRDTFNKDYFQHVYTDVFVKADIGQIFSAGYKNKVTDLKSNVQAMNPDWIVIASLDNSGIHFYKFFSESLTKISTALSFIFAFVVLLMTYTSISSIINKQRKIIGSQKSLGFRKHEVFLKYLIYAFLVPPLALIVATILGVFILEPVIYQAFYAPFFRLKTITPTMEPYNFIILVIIVYLCTLVPTYIACRKIIAQPATELLKDEIPQVKKAPPGKRSFLLSKMSFYTQVSFKNLLQNKTAVLTSLAGVLGCSTLIVCGLNLPPEFSTSISRQVNQVQNYQYIVTTYRESSIDQTNSVLSDLSVFKDVDYLNVLKTRIYMNVDKDAAMADVMVSETDDFTGFFALKDTDNSNKIIDVPEEGALISQKTAEYFGIKKGDTITVTDASGKNLKIQIAGIFVNYVNNVLIMSGDYYGKVFTKPVFNSYLVRLDIRNEPQLFSKLGSNKNVFIVARAYDYSAVANSTNSLSGVAMSLTVMAVFLAFAVLFNLAELNIEKRKRELSVMKAFGYGRKKLAIFIYKDNLIISIIGILLGVVLGVIWAQFVGGLVVPDYFMTVNDVFEIPSLVGGLSALVFAFAANLMTYGRIKQLDLTRISR